MNFHPNAWDHHEMTPDRTMAWFKRQSDDQIAVLSKHKVWYGPARTNPWRKRRRMAKLDEWHRRACLVLPWPVPEKPAPVAEPAIETDRIRISDIVDAVSRFTMVATGEIKSPRRNVHVVRARQAAIFIATCHSGHSLSEIGRHVGGRDHSTALHSKRKVQADLDAGGEVFGAIIDHVETELGLR